MGEKRCGDCRHWDTNHKHADKNYGVCKGIPFEGDILDEPPYDEKAIDPSAKAYTIDGSDFFSALKCRSDFGCVLFEPKS